MACGTGKVIVYPLVMAEHVPLDRIEQFARDTNRKTAAQLKLDLGM